MMKKIVSRLWLLLWVTPFAVLVFLIDSRWHLMSPQM
jgi:hypothetical protein